MKTCIIIGSFFIALVAWIFSIKPHYRPSVDDGDPPLSIRSGLLAVSFFPFLFACALKVNPISILTGISHARLQIYHQSFAFGMFFFGMVHTIPILWQYSHEKGFAYLKMAYDESQFFWTGTVCICLVFWILCSSIGVFRNFSYRFFVVQHIISVATLLGFLFKHVESLLMSHYYLWAAVAMWLFSIVVRSCLVLYSSEFFASRRAQVDIQTVTNYPLDDEKASTPGGETIRLSFSTPLRWRPGQHIYVRFPGFAVAQAHPFSIMSLPNQSRTNSQLVLLAKVHRGTTCKVFNYVKAHHSKERTFSDEVNTKADSDVTNVVDLEQQEPGFVKEHCRSISPQLEVDPAIQQSMIQSAQVVAFLDGPYGFTTDPASYDHVLLCAGGTGIAHVFPIAHHLLRRCAEGKPNVITKRLRLVWSTHSTGLLDWIEADLKTLLALKEKLSLQVDLDIYVTGEAMGSAHQTFVQTLVTAYGIRANVYSILEEEIHRAIKMESKSMAVYVCGPTGLAHDMSNSVADANWELAKGNMGSLHDIYLDVESFNW